MGLWVRLKRRVIARLLTRLAIGILLYGVFALVAFSVRGCTYLFGSE